MIYTSNILKQGLFFFFLNGYCWQEILSRILDLNKELTIEIIKDRHSKLTYLDTGVQPVPKEELKACSKYFSLPYEVLKVSLDHLLNTINDVMKS